jgi:site-specific DNA recombinase
LSCFIGGSTNDLSPRIKDLQSKNSLLEKQEIELDCDLEIGENKILDEKQIRTYAADLRELLCKGSIVERRSFLRTFVNRIEVNSNEFSIEYTIPLEKKQEPLNREVLAFIPYGSPGGI